jgi:hypothetical protein
VSGRGSGLSAAPCLVNGMEQYLPFFSLSLHFVCKIKRADAILLMKWAPAFAGGPVMLSV